MEGSVLTFLKAEWKVSDTAQLSAEPLVCFKFISYRIFVTAYFLKHPAFLQAFFLHGTLQYINDNSSYLQTYWNFIKLEAQHWAEPVSLTFHSALRKLNTEPSIGASHQISVHFGKAVSEKKIFRNQPI